MKKKLLKQFKDLYANEEIKSVMYVASKGYIIIECNNGKVYRAEQKDNDINIVLLSN